MSCGPSEPRDLVEPSTNKTVLHAAAPVTVGIALLGNRYGHLGYSSCARPPRGGLARAVAWLSQPPESHGWDDQVVLSVGNDLGWRPLDGEARDPAAAAELILRAYSQLSLGAVVVSEHDLSTFGSQRLADWAREHRVPLVASNLNDTAVGGPTAHVSRGKVIDVAGRRIALLALGADGGPERTETGERFRFVSPMPVARELLALEDVVTADLTIVSADLSDEGVERLLKEFPAIDVLVRVRRQRVSAHPEFLHGAMVVDIGERGEVLPVLEVRFGKESLASAGVRDANLRERLIAEGASKAQGAGANSDPGKGLSREVEHQLRQMGADVKVGDTPVAWRVVPLTLDLPAEPGIEAEALELIY